MLATSTQYQITMDGCRQAISASDGTIEEAVFAKVWYDLQAIIALLSQGEVITYPVVTRWSNE
jgi:hypothetical protein